MGKKDIKHRERESFSIVLHPHRSLSPPAFLILMGFIGTVSFGAGLSFLLMGAWPVLVFFGLVVFFVYGAFRLNYRSGRRSEILEITNDQLTVRLISPNGKETSRGFQAYWSRLEIKDGRLLVRCRAEKMEIGQFLIEQEKEEVRDTLTSALYQYRHANMSGP